MFIAVKGGAEVLSGRGARFNFSKRKDESHETEKMVGCGFGCRDDGGDAGRLWWWRHWRLSEYQSGQSAACGCGQQRHSHVGRCAGQRGPVGGGADEGGGGGVGAGGGGTCR